MKRWFLRKQFYRSDAFAVALVAYFWCLCRAASKKKSAKEENRRKGENGVIGILIKMCGNVYLGVEGALKPTTS